MDYQMEGATKPKRPTEPKSGSLYLTDSGSLAMVTWARDDRVGYIILSEGLNSGCRIGMDGDIRLDAWRTRMIVEQVEPIILREVH